MHRRRALQIGAALATLPLSGCGPSPEPKLAPTAGTAAGGPIDTVPTTSGPLQNTDSPPATVEPAAAEPPPPAPEPPKSPYSRVIGRVGKNHGHVLAVSFDDVVAGVEKTYDIAGTSSHPHTVTLSPDDMLALLAGQIVRTKSSRDKQHAHRVLVRCAPPVDPPEWVTVCDGTFSGQDEHELVIPAADMAAKADRTYDVQGIAGHPHELTVTAADFAKLERGEGVSIRTTRDESDAHLHVVFIQYRKPKA